MMSYLSSMLADSSKKDPTKKTRASSTIQTISSPSKKSDEQSDELLISSQSDELSSSSLDKSGCVLPSASLDISPIEKPQGAASLHESTSTSSTSTTSVAHSNDAIFHHILERISKIEEENSKLRLENDFLEERLTVVADKNTAHEKKIAKLTKDMADQHTKFQSRLDNIDNIIQFHAKENVVLFGTVREEILEHVYSSRSNKTSAVQNDISTGQSTISNKTLHNEFASLSHDNAVLNLKIDNLHDEHIFLNESLALVVSRIRDLFKDGEVLHAKFDGIMDTQATNDLRPTTNVDQNLRGDINSLQKKVYEVEKELYKTNQYNRRQNLVIDGIPDKIPQRDLERTAVQIIHKLGVMVHPREVVGCHRLVKPSNDPNSPTPTIIRFTNRKVSELCIKNSRYLNQLRVPWKLSFREDLCEANDIILQECEILKERGLIHHFLVRNGFVKTISKRGDFPRKINHPEDLFSMFPDNFET